MLLYPLALVTAFVLSVLLVPLVRRLCFRLGKVSMPRENRWNKKPMPTLGGVGMFLAFSGALGVVTLVDGAPFHLSGSVLAGSALMFGLGLLDDFKRLSPPAKLVGQFLAASLLVFFGHVINFFPWNLANMILTFFWLIGITNAINLLDNMDGLAGGVAVIAAGFLSYFFYKNPNPGLMIISLALAGSILGYLVFNFPPAKIIMGDSGSLFLGFTLAALAVVHRPRASDVLSVMGVPILLFLLPIIDTTLVTITRLLRGQSPAQGGTDHTSHRLIAFGFTERQAVLTLYAVALLAGIAGAVVEALDYDLSLAFVPVLLISLSLMVAYLGRLKVVTAESSAQRNLTRIMVDLTYRRRVLEILLDFFLIGVSFYLAFWTYAGFQMLSANLTFYARALPVVMASAYVAYIALGVYRGLWRYVGVDELVQYLLASLGSALLAWGATRIIFPVNDFSPVIFFLYPIFLFLGLAGSRLSFTLLDRAYSRQNAKTEKAGVLIYGAQDAGELALRWILRNPTLGYLPVGFIDDDPLVWGRRIHGVPVLGGADRLDSILEGCQAAGVILTSSEALDHEKSDDLLSTCRKTGVWVRVLKLEFELLE